MTTSPRTIGPFCVYPVGLGCMNITHAYGPPIETAAAHRLFRRALDLGCNFLDTATIYGLGRSEETIGEALGDRRKDYVIASKCVMIFEDGKRRLDASPGAIKRACEASLKRLRTDVIDLYYMHRPDPKVPIEDSVGALAELVGEGKIRTIGLSEMSADTLRRAHAVHPIAAMQSEYSLWTRNPEIAVIDACKDLGTALVAFSPVGRGFLADTPVDPATFTQGDIRLTMPRFEPDNYARNGELHAFAKECAAEAGCSVAQLAIAWTLARGDHIVPIPGTKDIAHLEENHGAGAVDLPTELVERLARRFAPDAIAGPRYSAAAQRSVTTEQFDFELAS